MLQKGILHDIKEITKLPSSYPTVGVTKYDHNAREIKHFRYLNIPCAYDIEVSSFIDDKGMKVALPYAHAINIDGHVFLARNTSEVANAFNYLSDKYNLNAHRRMIIYVHNLSYDFQFIKADITMEDVIFNGGERRVMTALTASGIELRCSYMLTGTTLANVAKALPNNSIKKLYGDLDYSLIRTPETPLTDKELEYILNDVLIIEYHIRGEINKGNILKIPFTQTGYVREYVRNKTIIGKSRSAVKYRDMISDLVIAGDEYRALRQAFAGGYTHANPANAMQLHKNVKAQDFASSYPARMVMYRYPMGAGEKVVVNSEKEFKHNLTNYCCLFYIKFFNIVRLGADGYLSESKLTESKGVTSNNGRVEAASEAGIWITDVDYRTIMKSYTFDRFEIGAMWRYKRDYLPKEIVESVLKLYGDKTKLKGVKGAEDQYNQSKAMLNSIYGMCVTDIARTKYYWSAYELLGHGKTPSHFDIDEMIKKENDSMKRFLYYPWGVWITAYARMDLFSEVAELDDDYIYCDTDSIYYKQSDRADEVFERSNARINRLMKEACDYHNIPFEDTRPKDPKGNERPLGVWSLDGEYDEFKTLGAKRYMVGKMENGQMEYNMTVSGINKNTAIPYMLEEFGRDGIMDAFNDGMVIPAGACGKSTHEYIDTFRMGHVVDYVGDSYMYTVSTGVHLEETFYTMSISDKYKDFIDVLRSGAVDGF